MIYSRTAKYGIKALVCLRKSADGDYKTVDFVADRTGIPADFLGKIFQDLARKTFLSRKEEGGVSVWWIPAVKYPCWKWLKQ